MDEVAEAQDNIAIIAQKLLCSENIKGGEIVEKKKDKDEIDELITTVNKRTYKSLDIDEIDKILAAINGENTVIDDFTPADGTRKIFIYDFKRPNKLLGERSETISMIHETFARLTTSTLSALLRSMVSVYVESIYQLTYEEFLRSTTAPTTLAEINMEPLIGGAVLEINPVMTFSILDRLFGGTGNGTEFKHELTDIEQNAMEYVITSILENIRESWSNVIDLQPTIRRIETNPQFMQIAPPSEMAVLVTLGFKVNDVKSMMNICIPCRTIEPIFDKLSNSCWNADIVVRPNNKTLVNREDIPLKLTAEILRREYKLDEIQNWKTGINILPPCPLTPNHCYLRLGDKSVWYCKMAEDKKDYLRKIEIKDFAKMPLGKEDRRMEMNNDKSVVTNALEIAKVMVTAELGSTELSMKELFDVNEGAILTLDKWSGEPVDIKANGVLIAKGEVIVVDGLFGVRITEIIGTLNPFTEQKNAV